MPSSANHFRLTLITYPNAAHQTREFSMFPTCVVLVASGQVYDTGVEDALSELSRRGYPVWRVRTPDPAPDTRGRMTAEALAAGFTELLFVHPAVLFDPASVEQLCRTEL